jgi:hypothetical protein
MAMLNSQMVDDINGYWSLMVINSYKWLSGWWFQPYASEKYDLVSDDEIPNEKKTSCSKPPTRINPINGDNQERECVWYGDFHGT